MERSVRVAVDVSHIFFLFPWHQGILFHKILITVHRDPGKAGLEERGATGLGVMCLKQDFRREGKQDQG